MTVRLQREDFDVAAEIAALTAGRTDIGAVVTFTGICRAGEGDARIGAMTLDHYPAMAQAELERIEAEARQRWPLQGVSVIHRFGRLVPGETIVLVVAASAHRQAAFEAAAYLMDYLKTRAPFWKREERSDGASWVAAREADEAAAARWARPEPDDA
ncbi:molybdenum cofactor biosynthesis protein MoaE [Labrys wisconsinensis]|uniref:Molybdopterin synthase catalytic subunit n=1 Tax=Labrys wisconsinensis TaxID=425677 RepID=A0ABU0JF49_9HYPH|nr:molybdenum cofactor biosynthesis protein MoaE [Labrys wisconsinensis]MDQ0472911.1 molybdopterin synthase catalytic subunit [Labrys wisconsinensis]